ALTFMRCASVETARLITSCIMIRTAQLTERKSGAKPKTGGRFSRSLERTENQDLQRQFGNNTISSSIRNANWLGASASSRAPCRSDHFMRYLGLILVVFLSCVLCQRGGGQLRSPMEVGAGGRVLREPDFAYFGQSQLDGVTYSFCT